jgi:hypothetical protein
VVLGRREVYLEKILGRKWVGGTGKTYLFSNGVDVGAELPQRHPLILPHHPRPIKLPESFVGIGLQDFGKE